MNAASHLQHIFEIHGIRNSESAIPPQQQAESGELTSTMGCTLSLHRHATISIPPAPGTLLSNPRETYYIPRPTKHKSDTPLATIYRIYWAIVMDDTFVLRNEIEYFWNRKEEPWAVRNIPAPPDPSPERFAIVSAIPFFLAAAFNRLIDLGMPRDAGGGIWTSDELKALAERPKVSETVPRWAEEAPPLATPLYLPTEGLGVPNATEDADPFLLRKNVWVHGLHIYFT